VRPSFSPSSKIKNPVRLAAMKPALPNAYATTVPVLKTTHNMLFIKIFVYRHGLDTVCRKTDKQDDGVGKSSSFHEPQRRRGAKKNKA
jgi:hypothetical protein